MQDNSQRRTWRKKRESPGPEVQKFRSTIPSTSLQYCLLKCSFNQIATIIQFHLNTMYWLRVTVSGYKSRTFTFRLGLWGYSSRHSRVKSPQRQPTKKYFKMQKMYGIQNKTIYASNEIIHMHHLKFRSCFVFFRKVEQRLFTVGGSTLEGKTPVFASGSVSISVVTAVTHSCFVVIVSVH